MQVSTDNTNGKQTRKSKQTTRKTLKKYLQLQKKTPKSLYKTRKHKYY